MYVLSVSRRTDIPAFYTRWFMNRIQAGFCHWLNPYGGQVYRVSLRPEDCLAIAFWTRNPKPLLPHLRFLRQEGYHFYMHFTINGYPPEIEENNVPLDRAIEVFRRAADEVGPEFLFWRYDPLLLSERTPPDYHVKQFDHISRELEGYTHRCYFSFVDFYGKTRRNLDRVSRQHGLVFEEPEQEERRLMAQAIQEMAARRAITLYSCCDDSIVGEGIQKAHCIDLDVIHRLRPELRAHLPASPTREDCGCVKTTDIGSYDTCTFGCTYCYATYTRKAAVKRMGEHDPTDSILWRPASLHGVDLTERELLPKAQARIERDADSRQISLF